MCECKTSPDWLWLRRGHLMRSVNKATLQLITWSNQQLSWARWGSASPKYSYWRKRCLILRGEVTLYQTASGPITERVTNMQIQCYHRHVSSSSRAAAPWSPAGVQLTTQPQLRRYHSAYTGVWSRDLLIVSGKKLHLFWWFFSKTVRTRRFPFHSGCRSCQISDSQSVTVASAVWWHTAYS